MAPPPATTRPRRPDRFDRLALVADLSALAHPTTLEPATDTTRSRRGSAIPARSGGPPARRGAGSEAAHRPRSGTPSGDSVERSCNCRYARSHAGRRSDTSAITSETRYTMTTLKIILRPPGPAASAPAIGYWVAGAGPAHRRFRPGRDAGPRARSTCRSWTSRSTRSWAGTPSRTRSPGRTTIDDADALVIITPEYNGGFPGAAEERPGLPARRMVEQGARHGHATAAGERRSRAADACCVPVTDGRSAWSPPSTRWRSRGQPAGGRRRVRRHRRRTTRPQPRCSTEIAGWTADLGAADRRGPDASPCAADRPARPHGASRWRQWSIRPDWHAGLVTIDPHGAQRRCPAHSSPNDTSRR